MEINLAKESLTILEALSSDTRINIIHSLSERDKNIKDLSNELFMSSAIVSRHIKKLEEAKLIKSYRIPGKFGSQKMCALAIEKLYITFPSVIYPKFSKHTQTIQLGHYTNYKVTPTCGLSTRNKVIGIPDDTMYFMDPERVKAEIIWFTSGFVEYKIPNLLKYNEKPEVLELSFEISSEFPGSNDNWPSDITFYVNDMEVGTWTVPGNYSDVRGKLTPNWWPDTNSQYGLLKNLRINSTQTNMDGELISNTTINDIDFSENLITFRFEVKDSAKNVGGLTIYGKSFGNYPQDIDCTLYYSQSLNDSNHEKEKSPKK